MLKTKKTLILDEIIQVKLKIAKINLVKQKKGMILIVEQKK